MGKGQNYENQNIKIQKEHRKVSKHQNIESVFLVHHYYDNQNIEKNKNFFFYLWRQKRSER
jgi:hypothetical protein